jgi:hypothetical protein
MNAHFGLLGALAVAVNLMSAPFHPRENAPAQDAPASPSERCRSSRPKP